jgi:hypothetical protein
MKIIAQIYKKLLSFFKPKTIDNTKSNSQNNTKEEYIGSLAFNITKNREIDILCSFPDLTNKDMEHIRELSEIYAEFLIYINEGYLKDDILDILENKDNHKQLTEEQQAKDRLFIDNLMFNWAILHVENLKKKKQNSKEDQPLIRPISVFNAT